MISDFRDLEDGFPPKAVAIWIRESLSLDSRSALSASFDREIDVDEFAPREIKKAIVGTGSATKDQIQHMITSLLNLSKSPSEDAADAIAVALCYSNQSKYLNELKKIGG